jgi:serine/threonine protein kinase
MRVSSAAVGASLYEVFPTWPRLSLDFTASCLRLDPTLRPTTPELLQHLYFTTDNFPGAFLPELRARIQQECQSNPLLSRRFSNTANSARGRETTQQQNQNDYEEKLMLPSTVNSRHNENSRGGSGPRCVIIIINFVRILNIYYISSRQAPGITLHRPPACPIITHSCILFRSSFFSKLKFWLINYLQTSLKSKQIKIKNLLDIQNVFGVYKACFIVQKQISILC